tara:strand:+ start:577 stop:1587 length:1011 start_codon:yes stop_codon:yes gene_type:complete
MANIKFSQFTAEANIANFDDIVGYQGLVNKRITPANLASSLVTLSGGPYLPLVAGNGNPLTGDLYIGDGTAATVNLFFQTTGVAGDVVEIQSQGQQIIYHEKGTSLDIGVNNDIVIDDSGVGGITLSQTTTFQSDIVDIAGQTGQNNEILVSQGGAGAGILWQNPGENQFIGYRAIQLFQWTAGNPVAYTNWTNGTPSDLPFDPTPLIQSLNFGGAANNAWTCANAAGGTAGQQATFTLGANAAGTWKVRTCQHWFDQTSQVEIRVSFNINGTLTDVIDEKSTELSGDKIFYGELVSTFSAADTLSVNVEFVSGGVNPFPSATGNRPIEITFERIV